MADAVPLHLTDEDEDENLEVEHDEQFQDLPQKLFEPSLAMNESYHSFHRDSNHSFHRDSNHSSHHRSDTWDDKDLIRKKLTLTRHFEGPDKMETSNQKIESKLTTIQKTIVSVISIILIINTILTTILFCVFEDNYKYSYTSNDFKGNLNSYQSKLSEIIFLLLLCISGYKQRSKLHESAHTITNDTLQSVKINAILLFVAVLYYSCLGTLGFINSHFGNPQAIENYFNVFALFMIGIHFIGNFEWGQISNCKYINKWCCIYLIIEFFSLITIHVISPWIAYDDFITLNEYVEETTGEFVHQLIIYLCYPVITIVAYRCIEQIMHQLTHHQHHQTTLNNESNNNESNKKQINIEFQIATSIHCLILVPIVIFFTVSRIMSLSSHGKDTIALYFAWCFIFGIHAILGIYVLYHMYIHHFSDKKIMEILSFKDIAKHLGLFISAIGMIIAIIGGIGVVGHEHIGGAYNYSLYIMHPLCIIDIIIELVTLVIVYEIKLPQNIVDGFPSLFESYGVITVLIHIILLFTTFLNELHHLSVTINQQIEHDSPYEALWAVLYFFALEFQMACIERIRFGDKYNVFQPILMKNTATKQSQHEIVSYSKRYYISLVAVIIIILHIIHNFLVIATNSKVYSGFYWFFNIIEEIIVIVILIR